MNQLQVKVGQVWKLWVYDYAYREKITIDRVDEDVAHGFTDDGNPCIVGLHRLIHGGELITDAP